MPRIQILEANELAQTFSPTAGKRAKRAAEMAPFHEVVQQLGPETPGGVIELDEDDDARVVMMRLHRAAHSAGRPIRFKRQARSGQAEIPFRLQTPDEITRLRERGRALAEARHSKRASA